MEFNFVDYLFGAIAIAGLLFIGYHHFFIKPKTIQRQKELDELFKDNMKTLIKNLNKEG